MIVSFLRGGAGGSIEIMLKKHVIVDHRNLLLRASRKVTLGGGADGRIGVLVLALPEHGSYLMAVSHGVGLEHGSDDGVVARGATGWRRRRRFVANDGTDGFIGIQLTKGN
eukprot:CAMPEP_0119006508 /NCGR_PEP_ID=MMETSP1176-20130426/2330_1 /TAXON_ID=265551 /ORGANISM="Synedropsis recta cf, Strain CCMP1620" /LENGTH=110 /DNA_ID=CAMNT_0006958421 /DNA_START=199 /DNA_END=531 /DNA_ORIENTATION=-